MIQKKHLSCDGCEKEAHLSYSSKSTDDHVILEIVSLQEKHTIALGSWFMESLLIIQLEVLMKSKLVLRTVLEKVPRFPLVEDYEHLVGQSG